MLIGGVLSGGVFYLIGSRDIFSLILIVIFGAFSALVPDLDHDSSKGRKLLDACVIVFAFLGGYLWACGGIACIPDVSAVLPMIILSLLIIGIYFVLFTLFKPKHRGITHTIAACVAFAILLYLLLGLRLAMAGSLGYFSHLIADNHVKLV